MGFSLKKHPSPISRQARTVALSDTSRILLRGHGYNLLPDPRVPWYGKYGLSTSHAVADYRRKNGLPAADCADSALLKDLVQRPAPKRAEYPAYVTLVMNVLFTPITRFVWLTSLFETGGAFGPAQPQHRSVRRFLRNSAMVAEARSTAQTASHVPDTKSPPNGRIIGGIAGSTAILDHTAKPNGGVDAKGNSIDPDFELTKDPWKSRLLALGASPAMQTVQLDLASDLIPEPTPRNRGEHAGDPLRARVRLPSRSRQSVWPGTHRAALQNRRATGNHRSRNPEATGRRLHESRAAAVPAPGSRAA